MSARQPEYQSDGKGWRKDGENDSVEFDIILHSVGDTSILIWGLGDIENPFTLDMHADTPNTSSPEVNRHQLHRLILTHLSLVLYGWPAPVSKVVLWSAIRGQFLSIPEQVELRDQRSILQVKLVGHGRLFRSSPQYLIPHRQWIFEQKWIFLEVIYALTAKAATSMSAGDSVMSLDVPWIWLVTEILLAIDVESHISFIKIPEDEIPSPLYTGSQ